MMKKKLLFVLMITVSVILSVGLASSAFACDFKVCKFNDQNGNGLWDNGEEPIPGWQIRIYKNLWLDPEAKAYTGEDGCLTIHMPTLGLYRVWEEQVKCWEPTAPEGLLFDDRNDGYYVEVKAVKGEDYYIEFGNRQTCEGCTPGYWKNHTEYAWQYTGYTVDDDFDTTFGVDLFEPDITLLEALKRRGGGVNRLARHGTAALLSAAHPGVGYLYSVDTVIELVQAGDTDSLEAANEAGCPLNKWGE
jgi:hypothetical protein